MMMKALNKILTVSVLVMVFSALSANAYEPIYAGSASSINKITDVTHQADKAKDSQNETYAPVAFAADLLGHKVDKNIYQNKEGVIVISKKYVPDNY